MLKPFFTAKPWSLCVSKDKLHRIKKRKFLSVFCKLIFKVIKFETSRFSGRLFYLLSVIFPIFNSGSKIVIISLFSPLWEMVQEGVDLKSIKWSQH